MRRHRSKLIFTLCCGLWVAEWLHGQGAPPLAGSAIAAAPSTAATTMTAAARSLAVENYSRLPLAFAEYNDSFVARGDGYSIDLRGARMLVSLSQSTTIEMHFLGGRRGRVVRGSELPGKIHHIRGRDPQRWQLGLPTYERVTYEDLYPGIDVVYYGNQQHLEFDLVLSAGADPKQIRLRFDGGTPRLSAAGSLAIGELELLAPKVFQGAKALASRYVLLNNGDVSFEVEPYDATQPLVIDPILVYAGRLGGGNGGNQGNAVAVDVSGNAFIAGYTGASAFPTVNAAFGGYQANQDAFVSKINPTGTALLYSTYIGGSSFDGLSGIAVDATGSVWAVGYTYSSDFPLLTPYQSTPGGNQDAVVLRLNPNGSLSYSTVLGGASFDSAAAVAVDRFGNAYVSGQAGAGFPTTSGVYQRLSQGGTDAFAAKFMSNGSILWSTLLGGTSFDSARGIAVDAFGSAYVTGQTYSSSFGNSPSGGAQALNAGNGDAFIAKLNLNATGLLYFTFLGGSASDSAHSVAVDPIQRTAVVAGSTLSADLPVTGNALQPLMAGASDGFFAKVNATGSTFLASSYLGGNRGDSLLAVALDSSGHAYVGGYTSSNTFPTSLAIQLEMQGNTVSLFGTSSAGTSWAPFDATLGSRIVDVSPDPTTVGIVIAATDSGVYRTADEGATWTLQHPFGMQQLSRSRVSPTTIYGLSGAGVYQSIDNGVKWTFRGATTCCAAEIIADPVSPATAYAINVFGTGPAVQKTVNGGVTWSQSTTGLPANAVVTSMAAASNGNLFIGLSGGSSLGGVYKSTNQGSTWAPVNAGLPVNIAVPPRALVVAPTDPSLVYVTDYFGLYRSQNGGTTWTFIGALPGGTSALAVSSSNPARLYYAAYYSKAPMWISNDAGLTWSPGAGFGVADVNRVVSDPLNGDRAYAIAPVSIVPIVAKIDLNEPSLLYSTYLGDYGAAYGLAAGQSGEVLVTGSSWQFLTTPSALQGNRPVLQNNLDAFLARISDATAPCSYAVEPQENLATWFTHRLQYVVTAPSGCSWTASSDQPWATIVAGSSGTGSGIVYVLANNNSPATRTATLTIAGQTVTLKQRGSACGYNTFSPASTVVSGAGGTVSFDLLVGAGCEWMMTNPDPAAITLVSGVSGTGNGTVTIAIGANLGPNTRTFSVQSDQGGVQTITQAGTIAPTVVTTITSTPSGAAIGVSGSGCIPGNYTTPASLTWNANTNCVVAFVGSQTIGGSSYVYKSASINGSTSTPANRLTVNSGSSPVSIHGNFTAPCTYALSPSQQSFSSLGGSATLTVTTASACAWNASTDAPSWVSGLSCQGDVCIGRSGSGSLLLNIKPNPGTLPRSATIVVADKTFRIDQQGFACTFNVSPTRVTIAAGGGSKQFAVTAPPLLCSWNAATNAPWLTVTAGASGAGNGQVTVRAAANSGAARTGRVTLAGQVISVTQPARVSTPVSKTCGSAIDVTAKVRVEQTMLQPINLSGTFLRRYIRVTNTSSTPINGPLFMVFMGLPSASASVSGLTSLTTCFSSSGDTISTISSSGLPPGQHAGWVPYLFGKYEFYYPLSYTIKVLSGFPPIK